MAKVSFFVSVAVTKLLYCIWLQLQIKMLILRLQKLPSFTPIYRTHLLCLNGKPKMLILPFSDCYVHSFPLTLMYLPLFCCWLWVIYWLFLFLSLTCSSFSLIYIFVFPVSIFLLLSWLSQTASHRERKHNSTTGSLQEHDEGDGLGVEFPKNHPLTPISLRIAALEALEALITERYGRSICNGRQVLSCTNGTALAYLASGLASPGGSGSSDGGGPMLLMRTRAKAPHKSSIIPS